MQGPRQNQIDELLLRWQQRHQVGETLSVEELCRDCPDLKEVVRQRIGYFASILQGSSSDTTTAKEATLPKTDAAEQDSLRIDGYTILERLGHGGMGVVWKGKQLATNRIVALKMLPASTLPDENDAQRFTTEIHALGSLNHPNIVQIHDAGKSQGRLWYAMEYVAGGSLAEKLKHDRLALREVAQLVETLARTMHAAHEVGIIHRDLKPGNILLTADGTAKIADFGLARRLAGDPTQTPTGAVLGTPCYMSPEQASGKGGGDPRSDVYSLGVILFELLTGQPPFRGPTPVDTIFDVIGKEPPPPRRLCPGLSADLEAVCLKCLEKDPLRRYTSAAELADDLGRWVRGEPTLVRPPRWPSRLWNWTARHGRAAAIAAAICATLLLYLLAGYLNDPRRRLERAQRKLARGEVVTWIDRTGPPIWSRWVVGEDKAIVSGKQQEFTVESLSLAMLELLPEVPLSRYRLTAEVFHDDSSGDGSVGLYLGHCRHETAVGEHNYFYDLTFTDRLPGGATQSPRLRLRRWSFNGERLLANGKLIIPLVKSDPANPPNRTPEWRRLSIAVTPEKITATEGTRTLGEITTEELSHLSGEWLEKFAHAPGVHPGIVPEGALGLYVFRGGAKFRFVRVESLPER